MPNLQPSIQTLLVQGEFMIKTSDNSNVQLTDFNFYDLSVEYETKSPKGTPKPMVDHFQWNTKTNSDIVNKNTIPFSFVPFITNFIVGNIIISVKGYDGTLLRREEFAIGNELLQNLKIEVPLKKPEIFKETNESTPPENNKILHGKVLELSGKCKLKGLTVLLQAKKEADTNWKTVRSATTDSTGNFSMQYPYGIYVAAQAIVSLTPDNPADVTIYNDSSHFALNQSIADEFLYLLLSDVDCASDQKEEDCDCKSPKKSLRLPGHEELITSGDYTQDIGGNCVNLSTPNRTLNEYTHTAVVRTSDPDVANYILNKETTPLKDEVKISFQLTGGFPKIERSTVDVSNPIYWQDAPDNHENLSLYQAVTVATGHILHYKVVMKSDGYSLGELLYSLPLAPGQKKEIVILSLTHTLQGTETQQISQKESLAASLVNDSTIADTLAGKITESVSGKSSATTGGASGGFGLGGILDGIGISLGIAGGIANANSTASQNSSRSIGESFAEKLRNSITQNAQSYRELNASVITTIQEGQQYGVTSEVVANHNHCHSLTMLYFEVLRHYVIYQELSQVEECLFIPLLLTNFAIENIYKWKDVLASNLLPLPSETYLQPFNVVKDGRQHPLLRAFDAVERKKTNYANVDYPVGAYDEEVINFITGEIFIKTNLPRPKSRYDRIKSFPVKKVVTSSFSWDSAMIGSAFGGLIGGVVGGVLNDDGTVKLEVQKIIDDHIDIDDNFASVPPAQCIRVKDFDSNFFEDSVIDKLQWTAYSLLLGYYNPGDPNPDDAVYSMLRNYFKGRLIAEWDSIYYTEIAPVLFEKIANRISIGNFSAIDFSADSKYKGGEQIMKINLRGSGSNKTRKEITGLNIKFDNFLLPLTSDLTTLNIRNVNIRYSTSHYNGLLYSGFVNDDLIDGNVLPTPENANEKRNPRKEDTYLVNKLLEELNSKIEYYNKVLWLNLDPDRRFMLLDGFNIQTFDDFGQPSLSARSLASVVKNEVIGIAGNALVMPVAPGYKVDRSFILTPSIEGPVEQVNLFDHYKPLTPAQPYRISIPTKGVYAEAVMGQCDACEKEEEKTSQDWTKFTTDEPTAINPITTPLPTITDWKAAFKDFATPVVNIQNAPAAPAPGAGLAGLSDLLGKAGIFKDVTGLDANQQNALKTYLSNQENAKAFAEMAKEMAMQGHNTEHSDKIMDSIRQSPELSNQEKAALIKDHLQQQIDGGQSKKAEQQNQQNAKPSLTDAAVKAVDQGKAVKATSATTDGKTESVDISGAPASENILAEITNSDKILNLNLKQTKNNDCWAVAATIMKSWDAGEKLKLEDVLTEAGDGGNKYLNIYNDPADPGLPATEKEGFISKLNMVSEPLTSQLNPIKYFIDLMRTYGPLWITVDEGEGSKFSPHAKILYKIIGAGTEDGIGTDFIFVDPATSQDAPQHFNDFIKQFLEVPTDTRSQNLFAQIVHFREVGEGAGSKKLGPPSDIAKYTQGFDVSFWQGNKSHFSDFVKAGKVFGLSEVTIGKNKAVYNSTSAYYFPYQWNKIKELSLVRGAYHLLTEDDSNSQVNALLSNLPRLLPGDLVPALDIESEKHFMNLVPKVVLDSLPAKEARYLTRTQLRDLQLIVFRIAQEWLIGIEKSLGRTPFIYTGQEKWDTFVGSMELSEYPLWTVHYNIIRNADGTTGYAAPLFGGWTDWVIWQYAEDGKKYFGIDPYHEPGIDETGIGLDYDAFNGTLYELRGFADMGRPAVALTSTSPYIAYCSSDNTLHLINGPDFNEKTLPDSDDSVGPPASCCDPVAIVSSDKVYLYYRRVQDIWEWASDEPNNSQKIDTISVAPIHDPRAIADGNIRYVVYWGEGDNWQLLTWNGSWSTPESLLDHAGPLESPGISTGQPVPYLIQGSLHVVGRVGLEGHLFDLTKDASGTWKSEDITALSVSDDTLHSLLPAATYSPCIFETTDGVFIVFRAVGGQLWIINQNSKIATNLFSHLSTTTPLCSGHPACFVVNNIPHIVFRGVDKLIYEIFPNSAVMLSSIWNTNQISGLIKAAAEPVATADLGTAIVSFRSDDGAVIVIQYDGTIWTILKQ